MEPVKLQVLNHSSTYNTPQSHDPFWITPWIPVAPKLPTAWSGSGVSQCFFCAVVMELPGFRSWHTGLCGGSSAWNGSDLRGEGPVVIRVFWFREGRMTGEMGGEEHFKAPHPTNWPMIQWGRRREEIIMCYCEALVLRKEPLGTAFMAKPHRLSSRTPVILQIILKGKAATTNTLIKLSEIIATPSCTYWKQLAEPGI